MSAARPSSRPDGERVAAALREEGIELLRAGNEGPLTLSGTNTWVVGRDPAYVVDPGPGIAEHVEALIELLGARGGLGGVALTHDHPDHAGAVVPLLSRMPAPLAAGRGEADVRLADGCAFGPLRAVATPGHAPDHFAFLSGRACFTGDAVLGEGSVFLTPDPGALAGYMRALRRLREMPIATLCPGHGPVVLDPRGRLDEHLEHRLQRERALVAALQAGARSVEEMLDAAWPEVPAPMRPFAAVTLAAHLDKLSDEGRLPEGVRRPRL